MEKLKAFLDADEEEFVREPALHDLAERYLEIDHSISYGTIQHELIDLESFAVWAAEKLPPA